MKIARRNILIKVFPLTFLFFIFFASIADANVVFNSFTSINSVQELVGSVTNWILGITSGIVIIFLIIGGVMYLTSFGDESRIDQAKRIITYAVIGLIVILISFSIVTALNKIIFGP